MSLKVVPTFKIEQFKQTESKDRADYAQMLTNILEIRFHLNGTDITSKETPNKIMKKKGKSRNIA